MARPKGRIGLLFLGVFIGIIAGILLAFWLNNNGFNFSSISNFFSTEKENKHSLSFAETEKINWTKKKQTSKFLYHKIDSLTSDSANVSLEGFLAAYHDQYPDSVLIDAYQLSLVNKAEDVVVVKDELLNIIQVAVTGLSDKSENNDLDSVLLDDRGYKQHKKNIVQVEFWKSPVNYQGYKWDTRKLILYGFYEFDYLRLKYFNEQYYMQYGTIYYKLDQSASFLSLSPLDNGDLIKQLNSL